MFKRDETVSVKTPSIQYGSESVTDDGELDGETNLRRKLKDRHISLIALAGIIGPGILIGASLALRNGPASLIIGFGIIGIIAFIMMQSLGELATLYPTGGTFSTLGNRFVDPAYGAAVGWNYVIIWIAVLSNEYNTVAAIMQFWGPQVPLYGYVLLFWTAFLAFQFLGVRTFGESEYWLALTKIVGMLAFYIFSIVYVSGGIKGTKAFGFHYWNDPGPFNDGFKGVANTFVFASTFYSGTEIVAVSAAEAENPSRAVPKAIRQTFYRIIFLYMGIALFYGLTVPYNDESLKAGSKTLKSPMTIAIARAGWPGGAHLINAFILITCISAINSSIYIGSRTIVNLANERAAPKIFKWADKRGVPIPAIVLMNAFGFLSLMNISTGAAKAYGYIVNISGVAVFIVWGNVCYYHIRFRKAWKLQGRDIADIPYKGFLFPYLPILGIFLNVFLTLVQGWSYFKPFDVGGFLDSYILLPFFAFLFVLFKVINKTKRVDLMEVDLDQGRRRDVRHIQEDDIDIEAKLQ